MRADREELGWHAGSGYHRAGQRFSVRLGMQVSAGIRDCHTVGFLVRPGSC
jgi:hypothetical protein